MLCQIIDRCIKEVCLVTKSGLRGFLFTLTKLPFYAKLLCYFTVTLALNQAILPIFEGLGHT